MQHATYDLCMRTTDLFGRDLKAKLLTSLLVKPKTNEDGTRPRSSRARRNVSVTVEHGECLDVLRRLKDEGVQFDSCVTDPPYHLAPTLKRFSNTTTKGRTKAEQSAAARSDSYGRLSTGFMGQQWDGGDIAFRPETWRAVYDVLRPGAFLLAFGGTRTYHRLVCAIEDSGFVIQDSVLDLIASDTRVQSFVATLSPDQRDAFSQILDDGQSGGLLAWVYGSGFPKRRDMLKPSWEPIVMAYKPGGKRELQIDECRIGTNAGWSYPNGRGGSGRHGIESLSRSLNDPTTATLGRWPANLCHDGSDEVLALFPQSAEALAAVKGNEASNPTSNVYGAFKRQPSKTPGGDTGSAARFFYAAKADADDRAGSKHPTVKPTDLMQWLVRLVTPYEGIVLDPFAGTGSTGAAAILEGVDAVLIERDGTYIEDIKRKLELYRNKRHRTLY
jgi:DNA modification methylase